MKGSSTPTKHHKFTKAEKLLLLGYASISIAYAALFIVAWTKFAKVQKEQEQEKNKA